jgi:hypothetical protein
MAIPLTKKIIILHYIGMFNRAPAQDGLNYWMSELEKGNISTVSALFKAFNSVEEGLSRFPQPGNYSTEEAYVRAVVEHYYKNFTRRGILQGTLTTGEVDYWVADVMNPSSATNINNLLAVFTSAIESRKNDVFGYQDYYNRRYSYYEANGELPADIPDLIEADMAKDSKTVINVYQAADIASTLSVDTKVPMEVVSSSGESTFSNVSYNVTISEFYDLSNIDDTDESVQTFIAKVADEEVNYSAEYIAAYNTIVDKTMNSNTAPLKMLFDMVDSASVHDISTREKISIKKNALMQMLTTITTGAQQTAMQLVDKKYKFEDELKASEYTTEKARADANMAIAQKKALEEQVIDNRRIRAMDSLGDTYGTMMAGGLVPNESMWSEYFRLSKELTRNTLESDKLKHFVGSWRPSGKNGVIRASEEVYEYNNIYVDMNDSNLKVSYGPKSDEFSSYTTLTSGQYTITGTYYYNFADEAITDVTDPDAVHIGTILTITDAGVKAALDNSTNIVVKSPNTSVYMAWQSPDSLIGGGKIISKGRVLANENRNKNELNYPGAYYIVDLSDWYVDTPEYEEWDKNTTYGAGAIVEYNGLLYSSIKTVNDDSPKNENSWVETTSTRTNVSNMLCDITVDGVNYWKHGDIIYLDEIEDPESITAVTQYRRMSGYSAGSSVKSAPDSIDDTNDKAS